ncbi:MAG: cytidyltransferase-related domain protein [Schlesneria sp.]|nr:cytidyltransferase-related domain protein [Schlesneria sp.]
MRHLADRWEAMGQSRICVIGDLILDRYQWGSAERISPEAPVLVLKSLGEEDRLGGAASVATLLRGLACDVTLIGLVGADQEGHCTSHLIDELKIDSEFVLVDPNRPTTWKTRILGSANRRQPHQLLRIDRESCAVPDEATEQALIGALTASIPNASAALISDYGKGVCTPKVIRTVFELAKQYCIPVAVDPAKRVTFDRYRGAPLVTPNRTEASAATGIDIRSVSDARLAGNQLCLQWGVSTVLLKLDREGLLICRANEPAIHVRTTPRTVCDVTGAGDMILAVTGLCLASGWFISEAAEVANIAAGFEVERVGVSQVSRSEILAVLQSRQSRSTEHKIISSRTAEDLAARYREEGRKVVFTNGCFDLFHAGHVHCLEQAASCGDALFVAVNSDESVRRLKGSGRPIVAENQRAAILAALACVDHVVVMEGDTPHELLRAIHPDVLVKGAPYQINEVVGAEIVRAYGGEITITKTTPGLSTTLLETQIINQRGVSTLRED